jgi:glycosyltransferase involved in cell wall biosynthesis
MKIALVAGDDLSRNSRVRLEARALAAAGHRVTVHGVLSPGTEEEDDEAGVVYVRVPLSGWQARGGGLRRPVRIARWYERFAPVVDAAVRRETPEAIHAHDLDVAGPAQDAATLLGVPFVYDVSRAAYVDRISEVVGPRRGGAGRAALAAAVEHLRRKGAALETKLRRRGIAATIADTASLAEDLHRRYGGARPYVVRSLPPRAAPKRTDELRRHLGLYATDNVLVFLGPLEDGCGADTAVRALKLLGERHVLVFLGCTPRLSRYEDLAESEGVAARVRFVPPAPQGEILIRAASGDVALVPTEPSTATHRLGVPPRLYAALAAGLPIVASDTREAGAVVRATGAGVLYPARSPQDPAALAEGVHTLLSDGPLRRTCAEAAVHAVATTMNWETESLRLIDLYDDVEKRRL